MLAGPISTFIHQPDECFSSAVSVRSDLDLIWDEDLKYEETNHMRRMRWRDVGVGDRHSSVRTCICS